MNLLNAVDVFKKYTSNYDLNNEQILLKYEHSFKVMELMGDLSSKLGLSQYDIELSKLIGLLHDIGRFEQYKKFESFSDVKTGIDHADESCKYLFDLSHINGFISSYIDEDDLKIIYLAIKYHNKLKIPDNLNDREQLFCKMIRDMDKVDIYLQMAIHSENIFDKDNITDSVLYTFKSEKTIDRKICSTNVDELLTRLAFIFDFNYNESIDILEATGNFEKYLDTIKVLSGSEDLYNEIINICYKKLKKGKVLDYVRN